MLRDHKEAGAQAFPGLWLLPFCEHFAWSVGSTQILVLVGTFQVSGNHRFFLLPFTFWILSLLSFFHLVFASTH